MRVWPALAMVALCAGTSPARAQMPRLSALGVLQPEPTPLASQRLAVFSTAQRRTMSSGARTALWAGIGAVAGFLFVNVTEEADGINSTEHAGAFAGACTGALFSLLLIPALWPSRSP